MQGLNDRVHCTQNYKLSYMPLWITFQNKMNVKILWSSQNKSRRELNDHGGDVVYHTGRKECRWSLWGRGKSERDFHVTSSSFWMLAQCAESEVFTHLHFSLRVMANITTPNFYTRQIFMHTYIKCTLMQSKNLRPHWENTKQKAMQNKKTQQKEKT